MTHLSESQVRDLLREQVEQAGGQRAWAQEHGVSQAYVSQILTGKVRPYATVLNALGLKSKKNYTYTNANAEG